MACVVAGDPPAPGVGFSQYLRTPLFYLSAKKKSPRKSRGLKIRADPRKSVAEVTSSLVPLLPAPPWHTSGGSAPPGQPYP